MDRILWIEDEGKIELQHYKTPLIRAGYAVDIASDATEAIQLLRVQKYDALIFDLIIPTGMDFETDEPYVGLELLKKVINGKIKGFEKYSPSKIMVFTVVSGQKIHKEIKDLGVDIILGKGRSGLLDLKDAVDKLLKNE
jgi:DNA-binding NarL/FixJ family response regulator